MPVVSKTEYLRLLNEALQESDDYRPGMRFVAHPDEGKPEEASGYTFVPLDGLAPIFSAIAQRIASQYTVG